MSDSTSVLILFPEAGKDVKPSLQELHNALGAAGARVQTHGCDENFEEILDAVEQADKVLVWR
jgi:hypothetical protein